MDADEHELIDMIAMRIMVMMVMNCDDAEIHVIDVS